MTGLVCAGSDDGNVRVYKRGTQGGSAHSDASRGIGLYAVFLRAL